MLQGIELQDPATGDRFDASRKISYKLSGLARDRDLMIYSCPTPVLNRMMDAVLLAPPLIITDAELDIVLERLDDAFGAFERAL
jgi:adenosylmethionine-8-amino-7-oxononanoate aminotransferase